MALAKGVLSLVESLGQGIIPTFSVTCAPGVVQLFWDQELERLQHLSKAAQLGEGSIGQARAGPGRPVSSPEAAAPLFREVTLVGSSPGIQLV